MKVMFAQSRFSVCVSLVKHYLFLIIKLKQIILVSSFIHFLKFLLIFLQFLIIGKVSQKQIAISELGKFKKTRFHSTQQAYLTLESLKDSKNRARQSFLY